MTNRVDDTGPTSSASGPKTYPKRDEQAALLLLAELREQRARRERRIRDAIVAAVFFLIGYVLGHVHGSRVERASQAARGMLDATNKPKPEGGTNGR